MPKYTVQDGQSIYDIALQLYGSLDYVVKLIEDNPSIANLNQDLLAGLELEFDDTIEGEANVLRFVDNTAEVFATSNPKVQIAGDYDLDDYEPEHYF